jgi:streptogramin lyase
VPVGPNTDPGTEIAGFRLEGLLGRGGMGAVYHARDLRLGRSVALKLLAPDLAENERFRARFLRESQLAASLDHPNVIPIYAAGEAEGQLYLAMRYVQGVDLRHLLAREGPLSPERALRLVGQTAEALDAAHERGLVHRDVKPANILVAERSGREHCYLVDFGLTKQTASISGLTGTGELVGTVAYTSPEQIRGEAVDARADIYSLGCVLFEALAGESPFARETEVATLWAQVNDPPPAVSAIRAELGDAIDIVFSRALAKRPEDRPESAGELVADAAVALGYTLTPGLSERRPRPAFWTRRLSRRALILAGVAGVSAAALGTGVGYFGREGSGTRRVRPGSVGVVDPDSRDIVAGIPVGFSSPHIAAGEGSVWVLDRNGSTITRIDPATNAVVPPTRGVPAAGIPIGLAVGEGSLWIAMNEGRVLSVLEVGPELGDLRRRIILETSEKGVFPELLEPVALAVGGHAVWALERARGQVTRIDPATGKPRLIAEGYGASSSIAVGQDAIWLGGATGVTKLDSITGVELGSAPVTQALGSRTTSIAVRPGAVWFVGDSSARLWRIDPASASVLDSTPIGGSPGAVTVDDGGAVWVASTAMTRLSRLDPDTDAVDRIELGSKSRGLANAFGRIWTSPAPMT